MPPLTVALLTIAPATAVAHCGAAVHRVRRPLRREPPPAARAGLPRVRGGVRVGVRVRGRGRVRVRVGHRLEVGLGLPSKGWSPHRCPG